MKKMIKAFAALAALALLGAGFVSCSDDDDNNKAPTVTATESTVKGTYTMTGGDYAEGESDTLVAVDGKIYLKMDVLADDGSSEDEEDSSGSVTYNLAYASDSTTHEPTATFADLADENSELYKTIGEKAEAGETSYIVYVEVGTYAIADGKVTGTMNDGEDEYPATATTDSATGHLKTFTVNFAGDDNDGSGNQNFSYSFAGKTEVGTLDMAKSDAQTLSADVTLNESDTVKVVLLAESNTAFGSDEIAANTESNGVTLTSKYKLKNSPAYKVNNIAIGLVIKNTCIKITGTTGKVKVVVAWSIAGKKTANERGVFVKVGDTINGVGNKDTSSASTPTATKNSTEVEGTGDIYIAASNECIIESITITSAN